MYAEKHHLVPSCEGGKEKALVCIDCGNQVHQLFTINELRDELNTIAKLRSHPKMQMWIKWIRRRNTFGVCMKTKKKK